MIELTFMMPWLIFLFIGVYDFGFYSYMLISVQNAARAEAVHNSMSKAAATDPDGSGCQIALSELQFAAYGRSMTGCTAAPLVVTPTLVTGASSPDGNDAAKVDVLFTTTFAIPLPGVLPNVSTIHTVAQVRINPVADF